jgi:y4mF family transcriptional regulator
MAKKSSKSNVGRRAEAARTVAARLRPRAQRELVDRIQPALKLSELTRTGEVETAERVRSSLKLPRLEAITTQATKAAAVVSESLADLTRARYVASGAVPVERRSALPSLSAERPSDSVSAVPIASAHDLGQLVRQVREQRKLSQQAFADLAGVGRRFISELENGKATLEFDKVLQVASACGIDVQARPRR